MLLKEFVPKSIVCLKEGYSWSDFVKDLFAGISVGVIALPLALAFAIASGVPPERGLFTAIVAGFLISLLGGSRVQIGGPTGAFVVIVFAVLQRHGYEGLILATFIAGIMMILMGIARLGVLLKFIPYSVTTGFTTGIALVIFTSQIKDFFGLDVDSVPPEFLDKCKTLACYIHTINPSAFLISFSTLVLIFLLRRFYPKLPGVIIAVILATLVTKLFHLPITTIEAKFGSIPNVLPTPCLPFFSYEQIQKVFPDAITIALLGAIESLLSALVADGLTGHKHLSNCELVAQGIGNIGSVLFGGIPATGAIARTTANIRLGARTPMAGMIHAITLLILMLFLAPLVGQIPLAALSAVLIFIAWNMSELPHFFSILKGQLGDAIVLLITFGLTVLIDLSVAVQIGVILSAVIFLNNMRKKTTIEACRILINENSYEDPTQQDDNLIRKDIPSDIVTFEIRGPFFYSVSDLLDEALSRLEVTPRVFILRMHKTPLIDATGIQALKSFSKKCKEKGILFLISGVDSNKEKLFKKSSVEETVGQENLFKNIDLAIEYAKSH